MISSLHSFASSSSSSPASLALPPSSYYCSACASSTRSQPPHNPNNNNNPSRKGKGEGRRSKITLVDQSMLVLRKRIHQIKMAEQDQDQDQAQEQEQWMAWEKDIYESYEFDSIICDAMVHLQTYLLDARPATIFGILALFALILPTSIALLAFNFLHFFFFIPPS